MADRPGVPERYHDEKEHRRRLGRSINELALGRTNNTLTLSLTTGAATSTVKDTDKAQAGQVAVLSPQDAAAAADLALGTTFALVTRGRVTVTHAASAIERTYGVVLQG